MKCFVLKTSTSGWWQAWIPGLATEFGATREKAVAALCASIQRRLGAVDRIVAAQGATHDTAELQIAEAEATLSPAAHREIQVELVESERAGGGLLRALAPNVVHRE